MSNKDMDELEILLAKELNEETTNSIHLKNDDHNSFEHVVDCLTKYCHHSSVQAEQCALLVHLKGDAQIKSGTIESLIPIKDALTDHGLDAFIEQY